MTLFQSSKMGKLFFWGFSIVSTIKKVRNEIKLHKWLLISPSNENCPIHLESETPKSNDARANENHLRSPQTPSLQNMLFLLFMYFQKLYFYWYLLTLEF